MGVIGRSVRWLNIFLTTDKVMIRECVKGFRTNEPTNIRADRQKNELTNQRTKFFDVEVVAALMLKNSQDQKHRLITIGCSGYTISNANH